MQKDPRMLATLSVSGTPFEVGQGLGLFGKAAVNDYLVKTPAWACVMQWRNTERASELQGLTREFFPEIWEEIEGLAQGLGLPADDVFLWNCRGDLWAMAPDGCTTVMSAGSQGLRITHNEDGDPGLAGRCAVASVQPQGQPAFASFVYPGSIPGHTFAVTQSGLAVTVNNIRWLDARLGVPRMVLMRALLATDGVARAVQLLRETPRAGGFHLAIADSGSQRLASVEFGPHVCSVVDVQGVQVHANHAIHPKARNLPQVITGSSGFRQIRAEQLAAQGHLEPRAVLADTGSERYPIYRCDPADPDNENTLGNVDIRIRDGAIEWEVRVHPGQEACLRFRNTAPVL
ncbi:C45 family peptidase [Yanghanlia caeni]|uniref:C45 family peptidase n=1 Tax=Yanghanlia caeni TaxID=3064283 RepID=A0ABU1D863_9BURK|nr:C45 family peptidase [Alcaligenaceae bacterium LG-2]